LEDVLFRAIYPSFLSIVSLVLNFDFMSVLRPSYILAFIEIPFLIFLFMKIKKGYRIKDVSFFNQDTYKAQWRKNLLYFIKPIAIILISFVVLLINPVNDIIYYTVILIAIGMMLWTMLDLINIQNKIIMRPLPQFNIRGGDEDAYKML